MRFFWFLYLTGSVGMTLHGQPATSNIYHFTLETYDSSLVIHSPQWITTFNPGGYNNQPHFVNDDEILISSQHPDSAGTDIYQLNLRTHTRLQLTATDEPEYSPTPMPGGLHFSTVRVETEPEEAQRLWQMGFEKDLQVKPLLPKLTNVGYHCWLSDSTVALFLVDQPNKLSIANVRSQSSVIFSSDIGRCLRRSRDSMLLYVHKITEEHWYLKAFNPLTQRAAIIAQTPPGAEDFCVTEDGTFLMVADDYLHALPPGNTEWTPIVNLRLYGLEGANRLAVRKDRLLIVAR